MLLFWAAERARQDKHSLAACINANLRGSPWRRFDRLACICAANRTVSLTFQSCDIEPRKYSLQCKPWETFTFWKILLGGNSAKLVDVGGVSGAERGEDKSPLWG
jgi:hypothetical protein